MTTRLAMAPTSDVWPNTSNETGAVPRDAAMDTAKLDAIPVGRR